jgi:hypothetical protein
MANTPHILEQVIALAKGRDDFELFMGEGGQPVRIRNRAARLWIMRDSENGSMYDRWSSDDGYRFVQLTEDEIEQGPAKVWEHLCTLADDIISHREETK